MTNLKTFGKRGLAIFVSVMMCLGILQTTAMAAVVEAKPTCGQEAHTHDDGCYDSILVCEETETASHTHDDSCYEIVEEEVTTTVEKEIETLACMDESEGHTHNSSCYVTETVTEAVTETVTSQKLTCGQEETEGHTHSDACYAKSETPTCGKEEHVHISECYANSNNVAKDLYDALQNSADKNVVLILNGTTLNMNQYTGGNIRVTLDGQTLTIEDGTVAGGTIQGNGANRVVTILNGGSVTLTGSTVITGGGNSGGSGVYVGGKGSSFTMEGGAITGNNANSTTWTGNNPTGQGGGVLVENGASFTMSGGAISGNTAGEGGGIFVGENSTFTMTGGKVDGNTATLGEGGGIYISGTGTITRGEITNNETKTEKDLGGGGIYIENTGKLNLKNAIITDNTANGLGGGLGACVHGKTVVYVDDGAIIFGNHSNGASYSQGYNKDGVNNGVKIDGHDVWENDDTFKGSAQDIFAAGDSMVVDYTTNLYGAGAIYVSNSVLGGGDANWSGYVFAYDKVTGELICDEDGNPACLPVDTDGSVVYSGKLLGMTAAPDADTIEAAKEAAAAAGGGVLISGNKSNTHGGGIGNNGLLVIGTGDFEDVEGKQDLDMVKELETPEESDRVLQDQEFGFVVTDQNGSQIGETGRNDASGNVSISFPEDTFTEAGVYTFYVKEQIPADAKRAEDGTYYTEDENGNRVIYDATVYVVTIEVTENVETAVLGNPDSVHGAEEIILRTLTVGEPLIQKAVLDENGNPLLDAEGNVVVVFENVNGIKFNNKYEEYEEPEEPETPEEPSEEPEDPKFPPPEQTTTTEENNDPPSEPTPEPETEIFEEPTPLAEVSEEPVPESEEEEELMEIPEDDVPLANVPKTGDISSIWYMMSIVAAGGLLVLRALNGKKQDNAE